MAAKAPKAKPTWKETMAKQVLHSLLAFGLGVLGVWVYSGCKVYQVQSTIP